MDNDAGRRVVWSVQLNMLTQGQDVSDESVLDEGTSEVQMSCEKAQSITTRIIKSNAERKSMVESMTEEAGDGNQQNSLSKIMGLEVNPQSLKEKFLFATFQIIAENGADALSANELIRKTNSSKGALFHHFKTLDELCLESLRYFRANARLGLEKNEFANLKDFLLAFVQDAYERQGNKAYFHIVHFFRDRALKDERFNQALNDLYEGYLEAAISQVMKHLPSSVDVMQVRELIIFVYLTIERMCYRKMTSSHPNNVESIVTWFIDMVETKLNSYQTA